MMKTLITDIQRFSLNDGPGIRTTVFFKGCNMRCAWCHNPETLSNERELMFYPDKCIGCGKCFGVCPSGAQRTEGGIHVVDRSQCIACGKCAEVCYAEALTMIGREMTVEQIMAEIVQDKAYYEASGGGVTLSGGEVLCHADFALSLARACRAEGIPVAIETNLSFPYEHIKPLLSEVDLVMADLKLFDDEAHKQYVGVSNKNTLDNLARVGKPLIVRTPLIPEVTDTKENLRAIGEFLAGLDNLLCYQLLNFNPLGASKYRGLDAENPFRDARPLSDERLREISALLCDLPIHVKVGE